MPLLFSVRKEFPTLKSGAELVRNLDRPRGWWRGPYAYEFGHELCPPAALYRYAPGGNGLLYPAAIIHVAALEPEDERSRNLRLIDTIAQAVEVKWAKRFGFLEPALNALAARGDIPAAETECPHYCVAAYTLSGVLDHQGRQIGPVFLTLEQAMFREMPLAMPQGRRWTQQRWEHFVLEALQR